MLEEKLQKIREYEQSKVEHQRQVRPSFRGAKMQLALILFAVEQTLHEEQTEASPSSYCIALAALLQKPAGDGVVSSVLILLETVLPSVPASLLLSHYAQFVSLIAPLLSTDSEAGILRPAIGCLQAILLVQDKSSWASASSVGAKRMLALLLALAMDRRPKVRKRAREAIAHILANPPPSPALEHPSLDFVAEFCVRQLHSLRSKRNKADHQLIHCLQLVKAVISANGWPSSRVEDICHILLEVCRTDQEFVVSAAFEVFEIIFDAAVEGMHHSKLIALCDALLALQPSKKDVQLLSQWLAVITRGYGAFAEVDPDEALQRLVPLLNSLYIFMEPDMYATDIRMSTSQCIISLITACIKDSFVLSSSKEENEIVKQVIDKIVSSLTGRYKQSWDAIFDIIAALFDHLRWRSSEFDLMTVLTFVNELRKSHATAVQDSGNKVIGAAIRAVGPAKVLEIMPLGLESGSANNPGRAWLLPILRENISNTTLQHFKTEFVPLSERIYETIMDRKEDSMETKILKTVIEQIWFLLPSYCNLPLDFPSAFTEDFAELLANILYKEAGLRLPICQALRNLVEGFTNLDHEADDEKLLSLLRLTKSQVRTNLDILSGMSQKMLFVLFNVYSQTLPESRGSIMECISAFLSIAPATDITQVFIQTCDHLNDLLAKTESQISGGLPPTSHTMVDLLAAITPFLQDSEARKLFTLVSNFVSVADAQIQKRAYKVFNKMFDSECGIATIQEQLNAVQEMVLASAETVLSPSRKERLAVLGRIVQLLPDDGLHFLPSILPEAVICTKEINEKARDEAYSLLVLMGNRMKLGGRVLNSKLPSMSDDTPAAEATVDEYLTMVSAGLAGVSPHMISATITALSRVVYEFKDDISLSMLNELVTTMDLFLTSNNREVVKSALGFVKISVISLPYEMMFQRLSSLVENLMRWSHEHKGHFKAKVRHILERLVRRFGYETIEPFIPEDDKKLIVNIRKTRERLKRRKEKAAETTNLESQQQTGRTIFASEFDEAIHDSDSDASAEDASHSRPPPASMLEQDGDEPLDLLDSQTLARVSSRPPKAATSTAAKQPFKTDRRGRLLIADDVMEEAADGSIDLDEGDAMDAYVSALKGRDATGRGQRQRIKFDNRPAGDGERDDPRPWVKRSRQKKQHKGQSRRTQKTVRAGRVGKARK